ncbi:hypothetical protein B0H17DRAFT_1205627 [Mycena rosella]|uniref:Uncharacterized protein n=1 Tax=Mycena rosella TaxID=1033263 RepID=A0AAD7D6K9_MYCRO|nr:hypothetical protein B0H17DRAFT_1205627 [Mycena rosella]
MNHNLLLLTHHQQSLVDNKPMLSLDLKREIFETTALMHPSAIQTLIRVARRVLFLIEPFLYRVVRVDGDARMAQAFLSATKAKPARVAGGGGRGWPPPAEVLRLCTGSVNLSIAGYWSSPAILPVLANMRVQRLNVFLLEPSGSPSTVDLTHPLFASLTHLDIQDDIEEGSHSMCALASRYYRLLPTCA